MNTTSRSGRVARGIVLAALSLGSFVPCAHADEPTEPTSAPTYQVDPPPSAPPLAAIDPATESRGHWQPHWERFSAAGAVLIGVAEGAAFGVYLAEPVRSPRWTNRLPGDDDLRSAWRLDDAHEIDTAVAVSDAMFIFMLLYPIADALILAGAVHGDTDAALQMVLIDIEALAVAQMVTWMTSRLTGRVRPEAMDCAIEGTCEDRGSGPVASFVGGHAMMSFTAASLVCTHHIENPWLTGSREGGAGVCTAALSIAAIVSFMRVGADRHWASDVGIGAALGAAIGFGLPYLMHYGRARPGASSQMIVTPGAPDGSPLGLGVAGMF